MDLIDRQAVINAIHSAMYPYFCGAEDGDALSEDEKLVLSVNKAVCTAIKALPSADVQPVRHGKWLKGNHWQPCSVCRYRGRMSWKYCPYCGTRMDGEQDG